MKTRIALLAALALGSSVFCRSAEAPERARGPQRLQVSSPELAPVYHVKFRLLAPKAESVRLVAGDIPGNGQGVEMTKGTNGVWEVNIGPIDPGAYRYRFDVDGVQVVDPNNPAISESNNNVSSLLYVPGADFMDTKDVPHGAVAAVTYYSSSLNKYRRMHVYTPPGYEMGEGKYPVFYLLHGAGDCDEAWTSVGRAGFILDNLIAAGKAKPMIVVMPAGHTRPFTFGGRRGGGGGRGSGRPPVDEFVKDFENDIMPYVEKNYRVHADQTHRAIAGLSMGGGQTLNIAIAHLDNFAYVGVFSSGVFGIAGGRGRGQSGPPAGPTWEERNRDALDNPEFKKGVRLIWFSTGKDDFLIETSRATVEMLKKHGFEPEFHESSGAHTWINWRNYLEEFAPQLFQ
jgi:enterochelin esterase-like enzyme